MTRRARAASIDTTAATTMAAGPVMLAITAIGATTREVRNSFATAVHGDG
jgi:hypothetical protein